MWRSFVVNDGCLMGDVAVEEQPWSDSALVDAQAVGALLAAKIEGHRGRTAFGR